MPPASYFSGDTVAVKSAREILATLDDTGSHEGLPFLPEMVPYIGRTMTVHRRADRTCVEGHGLRRMEGTVFLAEARCDGAAHDGCQRGCLTFWKEAWLRHHESPPPADDEAREQAARQQLTSLATRRDGRYFCQSTQLATATKPLPKIHLGALFKELANGETGPLVFLDVLRRVTLNLLRSVFGLPEMGLIVGAKGPKTKGELHLQPGDWVRIKTAGEIQPTLGPNAKNLGLSFEPEMARSIGEVHQVEALIERIVLEETGQMATLTKTVTLKNVLCHGVCSKNCPRANPLFWREIWLERVAGPPEEKRG